MVRPAARSLAEVRPRKPDDLIAADPACEHCGLQQALQIDDRLVPPVPEPSKRPPRPGIQSPQSARVEWNALVDALDQLEDGDVRGVDEPVDACLGVGMPQGGCGGNRVDDVSQRTEANDEECLQAGELS